MTEFGVDTLKSMVVAISDLILGFAQNVRINQRALLKINSYHLQHASVADLTQKPTK